MVGGAAEHFLVMVWRDRIGVQQGTESTLRQSRGDPVRYLHRRRAAGIHHPAIAAGAGARLNADFRHRHRNLKPTSLCVFSLPYRPLKRVPPAAACIGYVELSYSIHSSIKPYPFTRNPSPATHHLAITTSSHQTNPHNQDSTTKETNQNNSNDTRHLYPVPRPT